ncbi:ABC transporter ATP-binding protein [Bacillus sp. DTU_2020_1000418_1_SI_GHA_SEK_038]|uniref:ABC transporter ATP-binding protein n=1 Tax=Bacillus sp. DTU_2020_1000418_1_SI_GHA_SEK_038 TaxID=3077585 RepID=UPI0028EBD576|nr:ABC transporter ATP-binding protein [Bacillus sp. DTU_2020_1000418_1_SI_GHA_SEK_038]WNS74135.1 ABC transporter ATP-binding protein [Bacillus sp. DTU_2020_1000418_1_SI_GHA_SEK_038]
MEKIVTFKNVSWRRSGQEILSNLNWEIDSNEHWAILGLNGSGKTSLLNIVTGYQFPTAGEVAVLGNIFGKTNLPELRREIGFVSSSLDRFTNSLNHETVEEIVLSGKFASIGLYEEVSTEDVEKAESLLSSLRLDYLKGKHFRLLSQGEKRRVIIARALMSNPRILILDEPCTGLDVLSREEVLFLMKEIVKNNCHLVYVTHHIEELVEEITHALLLRDGKIIAAGPKREVLTDELLTDAFKTPVSVRWEENRPWLAVKKESIAKLTIKS